MDVLQRGILTLVRSALTGEVLALPEGFRMEDAVTELKRHQIVALAYEGAVKCGIPKTEPVMQELFRICYQGLLRSEKQLRALNKLYAAFEENGIDYLPVKGCNLKYLYPRPELRPMGDADILIRMEQYEKISALMESMGYTYKEFFEGVYVWHSPALLVELHEYLMPDGNVDFHRYFADSWKRSVHKNGCCYALEAEDEYVFTFVHFAKHYRGGGIGLRQPVDLWVWQRAYPDMDMEYVRQELDSLKLLEFYDNTQRMLGMWFANEAPNEKLRFMTDYIFLSGSWGLLENHYAASGVRDEKRTGSKEGSRQRFRMQALFPPAEVLSRRYPVLKKAPWLLPVMWPVRWVGALLFRRENIRSYQKSLEGKTDEKLESFEQSLSYVGLGFDF